MANKYMKKDSLPIKEVQIRTALRFLLLKLAIIKKTNKNKCEDEGKKNPHTLLVGM
jgi:hypothetical protein